MDAKVIKKETKNWFNTVLLTALVPDEVDRNGDIITQEEITKTAYEFAKNLHKKEVNIDHKKGTTVDDAAFVESYIMPIDFPINNDVIPAGSWIIWIQYSDEMFKKIQDW